jgi:hypothetical protein
MTGFGGLMAVLFSGQLGCFGVILGAAILIVIGCLIYAAIPYFIRLLEALLLTGALFGLGITIRNYALALYHNIKPEKVTP